MGRKRDKPYPSPHHSTSFAKRRRHQPPASLPAEDDDVDKPLPKPAPPLALVVVDLPSHCSVLDLKSRFEIYGSISRIRIDRDCVGYIMYRTKDSADAAMAAALDPSFGFTIDSKKVQVLWANDPQVQWRQGINVGVNKNKEMSSKLLRAEVPLSRHGRGNKLASTVVNPRKSNSSSRSDEPFRGREVVAYDDIL
ncbi:uncharacterized protein At1g27050 [Cucurbita pepo subsp. pepo]|uniref:uncharacterized protein At1g27050 n=1 Tax=Cucurbita pepo subsp. pepo TaxID=3664 RepID=UPI000C9D9187|nr:uncharacterized protein At1g27050 [Cucurbita pepo subsp. pepo]